jgi:pyrimidine operon attenuation protein/uracil phosphoribosyltransferase
MTSESALQDDRAHRELPIEAAFIGRAVPTTMREVIEVKLREVDSMEKILLVESRDAEHADRKILQRRTRGPN